MTPWLLEVCSRKEPRDRLPLGYISKQPEGPEGPMTKKNFGLTDGGTLGTIEPLGHLGLAAGSPLVTDDN